MEPGALLLLLKSAHKSTPVASVTLGGISVDLKMSHLIDSSVQNNRKGAEMFFCSKQGLADCKLLKSLSTKQATFGLKEEINLFFPDLGSHVR